MRAAAGEAGEVRAMRLRVAAFVVGTEGVLDRERERDAAAFAEGTPDAGHGRREYL